MEDLSSERSKRSTASSRSRSTAKSVASSVVRKDRSTTPPPPRVRGGGGLLTNAIGRVVNPFIDVVDIDGVIQRIDVNDVVSRIDWNAVVDEIDWNNLLDQVDIDALIDRVDVNRAVERVDVNAVIERSNLKQIIARSTSGMCSIMLDKFRAICIKIDQILQRTGRCAWCCFWSPKRKKWTLPPLPTVRPLFHPAAYQKDLEARRKMKCPKKSTHLATAVQGRNAGVFSRFLAYLIDRGFSILFAFLGIYLITSLVSLLPQNSLPARTVEFLSDAISHNDTEAFLDEHIPGHETMTPEQATVLLAEAQQAEQEAQQQRVLFGFVLPFFVVNCLSFIVDALSMATVGRTVGKIFLGLIVVDSRFGKVGHIRFCQAILRAFLTNYVGILVWVGSIVSLIREDRRGLIDLFCSTTVIYAWDAKNFRMAAAEMEKEAPFGSLNFESLPFDQDEDDSSIESLDDNGFKEYEQQKPPLSPLGMESQRDNNTIYSSSDRPTKSSLKNRVVRVVAPDE